MMVKYHHCDGKIGKIFTAYRPLPLLFSFTVWFGYSPEGWEGSGRIPGPSEQSPPEPELDS